MDLIISVNNSNIKFNFSNTNYNGFPYSLVCYEKRFSVWEIWRFDKRYDVLQVFVITK